ncbi:MAG: FAD-dependent oxidoreductase [Acidobacteria bacterium]|nr:FAD-dependent oxidoreductase [Acidobacteriota bacterium]
MSSARKVVVVGGVAAGMSAASQARRRDPAAEVTVLERGPYISYGACGMPYNIEDPARTMDDLVVLTPERAREERGIDLRLRHEVTAIDPDGGTVTVRNLPEGSEAAMAFDALVLATGARAVRLPLPGMDLPGVFVLRELVDGQAVKRLLEAEPKRAVIIGAGYIGMEMAHVLTARGLKVTVLEKLPQILPGWSADTVAAVGEELERNGVAVRTGVAVKEAKAGPDGRVAAVVTEDARFKADLVLASVGIRPNVSLAAEAGLRIGDSGAIWVSLGQQTSHDKVWSAGDCAEAYHRVLRKNAWIPLGTTANKQGRVAGANAVGAKQTFRGIVGTAGFVVFGLQVARSGISEATARAEGFEPVSVTVRQRSRGHGYPGGTPVQVTLVADGPSGLLLGGEVVGAEGAALRSNVLAAALVSHLSVADLQSLDLVYAPPFAPVWDPLLVAANQLAKKVKR